MEDKSGIYIKDLTEKQIDNNDYFVIDNGQSAFKTPANQITSKAKTDLSNIDAAGINKVKTIVQPELQNINNEMSQLSESIDEISDAVFGKVEHKSINRFNPNTAEQKYFSDGAFVYNSEWTLTDVIECNFGDTIYAKYFRSGQTMGSLTFDTFLIGVDGTIVFQKTNSWKYYQLPASHPRISELLGVRIAWKTSSLVWENRAYADIRFNEEQTEYSEYTGDYSEKINIVEDRTKSRWKDKNVLVFGDSISTPNYPLDSHAYPKWTHYLSESDGFNLLNYSVHGYGYLCGQGSASQGQYNMIHQIETAKAELESQNVVPDLIILFMGTNDFGNAVDIGTFGDGMYNRTYNVDEYLTPKHNADTSVINTFYGAVEHCMARIKEIWNNARIVVLLPLQREYQYSATSGKALIDYANIIKETADLFSYPTLDLYHCANFCPVNKYDRMKTYKYPSDSPYAGQYDGLHPNEEFGKDVLAVTIGKFIENI